MGQPRMSVVSSHDLHALGGYSIQTVMHCECNLIVFSGGPWIQQHKRRRFSKQGKGTVFSVACISDRREYKCLGCEQKAAPPFFSQWRISLPDLLNPFLVPLHYKAVDRCLMNAHTIDTILDLHAALESQLGSFRSVLPARTGGLLSLSLSFFSSRHLDIYHTSRRRRSS